MGSFYAYASPFFCMYRMSYDQLMLMWRQGWINQKMQAVRIAGHMWGHDVDQEMLKQDSATAPEDAVKMQFETEFGMSYKEYLERVEKG